MSCCKLRLGQFTSYFAQLLKLIVLRSVYFSVKFRFFIQELWERVFTNIVWMLTMGISCALGAAVYYWFAVLVFQKLKKWKNCRFFEERWQSQIQFLVRWMLVIGQQTTRIGFLTLHSVPDIHFSPKLVRSYSIGEWKNPIDLGINTDTSC